jgi:hypothetical protein
VFEAAFVIILAVIPIFSPAWWLTVVIAAIAFLVVVGQAVVMSQDDKARDERESAIRSLLLRIEQSIPKSVAVQVSGSAMRATAGSVSVATSPRIYPDIKGVGRGLFSKTKIILSNRGSDVAHKICVEPIVLQSGSITFSKIETLAPGITEDITATAENTSALSQHNITSLLMRDWDAKGIVTSEFLIPMRIIYEDVIHQQFETTFDLIYLPVKDIVEQNPFEIRNLEIRVLT